MQSVPQSSSAGGGPERPPLLLDSFAELELPAHWSAFSSLSHTTHIATSYNTLYTSKVSAQINIRTVLYQKHLSYNPPAMIINVPVCVV